ncbi:MAG: thymidylate kinase [bacterium]
MSKHRFYGQPLPGVDPASLVGKLFVVEGADGSGRSTQINALKDSLERRGCAVVNVGLRRSNLVGDELAEAKEGNILGHTTLSLFYATDFADQLENIIVPALRAGFIVLADRYIYTLMARDIVRGADPEWIESLYSIAIVPDAVYYLRVSPQSLVERNFQKRNTLDYWESGMDLGFSHDMFESFVRYQKLMRDEFRRMENKYGFEVINGSRSMRAITLDLDRRISMVLERENGKGSRSKTRIRSASAND